MQENESSLPSGFRPGKAAAGGDCFFDSFRQGLEETKSIDVTVKALRGVCKDFASKVLGNPSDESYNWFRNAIKGKLVEHNDPDKGNFENIDQYVREIYESKVWGDSDIEGRIFCGHYGVKLYVAEMQKGADKYNYVLVDSEGVHDRGLDPYDYDASDTIRLVNQGTGHFEPVLRKQNYRGSDEPLNDLKKDIEGYLGESFHFANIFADSKGIYLGYSNNQNGTKEERLKFAVLTNEKDSQDQQIVRCYTISRTENISGSRFSEGERVLMKNALSSGQSFAFKEHKMFIRKDGGLVCKPFSRKQEFPKNVKGPCDRFEALNVPFSPPHASTPITRRNIPRGHDKAYAYKFLEDLLKIEMSPDVLVDIIVDSEDDTKIAVVGRPKVLGSSRKQMRHVIPYSSIKSAIESAVKVKEKGGYILHMKNMVEQVMTPLIISREGLCLTEGQYDQLRQNNIISSDEHNKFKLTTKTKKGQRNKYHLIYDKEIIETINKEKIFTEEEIKKARTGFNARLRKYISHGIDYLTDGLAAEDINTVTIMCEGVARIILTMFNQDIHAAFPEEGNTLSEEIRLYKSQNDAKEPKAKVFDVLLHDEITQEIVGDYNLRIRIVNNEGYIVKRTAYALSVLDSLLGTTNINAKKSEKYLDDYNEKCNFTIRAHSQDLDNYNEKINKNNLNDVLYNHVAKHLYAVFDFKPLERRVLAPRQEGEQNTIEVYPSATEMRTGKYSIQEGNNYRESQINSAKGYNDKAVFRSEMADKLIGEILSSKIVSHVIIHLVPYEQLKEGFIEMEMEMEEGLGNGMQKILESFIDLVRQDYINAPFHERIVEVLNDDWVNRTLEKYQEQNQSFSEASSMIVDESHTKKSPGGGSIDESRTKKPPGDGDIDGIGITKLSKEVVVVNIEQHLKIKDIYKGGYMKRSGLRQMALEGAHSNFLCDTMSNNDYYLITEWVENNLMKGDNQIRGGKTSRTAFYEAEKSLIREYILEGKFDNIVTLLDAIHNEKFKSRDSYKELKIKECEVLTGAIVMARGSLERDDTMHKNLNDLLKDKQEKLKKMEDIDLEKDGVSTKITEALNIVQVNSAGSSKGK
ncbi:OTU domain-containing protein [Wolbachia endosymbiont (group B) of Polyommatus icarus]|uniref:hypothetical protein n=1 Tax=Wolbachia endosymbiont (group B) of Polyommatus icarus TaxID=2954049 RepID=UPI002225B96E|nr:hypothetical protein [Wolbachia endosymbiont (group B) of Polyommatus icarus]